MIYILTKMIFGQKGLVYHKTVPESCTICIVKLMPYNFLNLYCKQFKDWTLSEILIFRRDLDDSFTSSRINVRILGIYLKYIECAISTEVMSGF